MPYAAGQRSSATVIAEAALKLAQGVTDLMPCFNLSISATEFLAAPVAEKLSIQRFFATQAGGNGGPPDTDDAGNREASAKLARRAARGTIDNMFKRAAVRQAASTPGLVTAASVKQGAQPEHARHLLPAPDPPQATAPSPAKPCTTATAPDQPTTPVVLLEVERTIGAQPAMQHVQAGPRQTARHSASGERLTKLEAREAQAASSSRSASAGLSVPHGPLSSGGGARACSSSQITNCDSRSTADNDVSKHDGSNTAGVSGAADADSAANVSSHAVDVTGHGGTGDDDDITGHHTRPQAATAEGQAANVQQQSPQKVETEGVPHAVSPPHPVGHNGVPGGSNANHDSHSSQAENVQLNAISIAEQRRILDGIQFQKRRPPTTSLLQQSDTLLPSGNSRNLKRLRSNKQTQLHGFFRPKP